ncbi:MAG: GGDEF domain-containing protein [Planctomycetes bacterium]|nr:GGDEF domain-containing protein [Planctomycetota bacterium]
MDFARGERLRSGLAIALVAALASVGGFAFLRAREALASSEPEASAELSFAIDLLAGALFALASLGIFGIVIAQRAWRAQRHSSRLDPLTGLYGRRLFHELLSEEVAQAARYGRALSLAIVDLDAFKTINDSLGHRAGDRVLQGAAEVLRASVRKSDYVFRYGGEEFAILMPETDEVAAAVALERVRRELAEAKLSYGRGEVQVRCSIGVTAYRTPESEEELVVRADRACYAAKRRGRDQVVLERVVDGETRELSLAELAPITTSGGVA